MISNSSGWQWQNTCTSDPQSAERLWLAMAVATLWMVIQAGEAENQSPHPHLKPPSDQHLALSKPTHPHPLRQISNLLLGFLTLMADLLNRFSIHLTRWSCFLPSPVEQFYYSNSS